MSWFDDQGFANRSDQLEQGGYTGQTPGAPPPINNAMPPPPPAQATPSIANVGHNDTTSGGLNREQWRDKWMSSGVKDIEGLKQFVGQHGGQVVSDNGTVTTPFGDTLDILANARTGNGTPSWTQVGAASDGQSGGGGGFAGGAGGGFAGGNMSLGALGGSMQPPGNFAPANMSADAFKYDKAVPTMERLQSVKPLTAEDLQNDPAYQFRLKQGIGALQSSAAARGSVRDANVWKGLIDYGQEAASQEADRITNRNLATTGANNAAISGNNSSALGAQGQDFGQALGGYQANLGALGQNFNNAAQTWNLNNQGALGWGNLALNNKQADNSYSLGQGQLGLGRDQFGLQQQGQYWNQAFNNNAQQWDQYYKLAQLGYPQS